MLTTLLALTALAGRPSQQADTTVPVRSGARLEVNNFGGEIAVKTWTRSAVRVEATHSSRDHIRVDASETLVSVKSEGRHGPAQVVDYTITVPPWMGLRLAGVYTDIKVEGAQNEVTAETVQGEVTVQGAVTLEKARGRIDLNSVNEDIRAADITGDLSAETVNGGVTLQRIESANVEATSVNGDISYDGTVQDGGRYHFSTHNGSLAIGVPEKANVTVAVSTFNGDFNACFPVQLTQKTKHRFDFTIGSGSARLELESFDGDIKLCRPGHFPRGKEKKEKEEE